MANGSRAGFAWANTSVPKERKLLQDYGEGGIQLNWFWPISVRVKVSSVGEMLE